MDPSKQPPPYPTQAVGGAPPYPPQAPYNSAYPPPPQPAGYYPPQPGPPPPQNTGYGYNTQVKIINHTWLSFLFYFSYLIDYESWPVLIMTCN